MQQFSAHADKKVYPFILADLPYDQNALAPHLTKETFDYHHKRHHQTYVTNLNNLLKDHELQSSSLEQLIHTSYKNNHPAIFNNAAQVWNHSFYWHCLKPKGGGMPNAMLLEAINKDFGDFETFSNQFQAMGAAQFGSGWVWLVWSQNKLEIVKTSNADTPITTGKHPILTCDVWEHAYYIDYRNQRAQYLKIFMENLINWEFAAINFSIAQK